MKVFLLSQLIFVRCEVIVKGAFLEIKLEGNCILSGNFFIENLFPATKNYFYFSLGRYPRKRTKA